MLFVYTMELGPSADTEDGNRRSTLSRVSITSIPLGVSIFLEIIEAYNPPWAALVVGHRFFGHLYG